MHAIAGNFDMSIRWHSHAGFSQGGQEEPLTGRVQGLQQGEDVFYEQLGKVMKDQGMDGADDWAAAVACQDETDRWGPPIQ